MRRVAAVPALVAATAVGTLTTSAVWLAMDLSLTPPHSLVEVIDSLVLMMALTGVPVFLIALAYGVPLYAGMRR